MRIGSPLFYRRFSDSLFTLGYTVLLLRQQVTEYTDDIVSRTGTRQKMSTLTNLLADYNHLILIERETLAVANSIQDNH